MKTKKYQKIASLAVVAAIFIWTFVFLYRKSQPTVKVYETIVPETADLAKTTVATGKVEPRDEVLFLVIPSFTISRLSLAVCNSSRACFTFTSPFSYSSLLMSLSLNNFSTRAKSVSACLALISARRTRLSAEFSVPSSGITFTLAKTTVATGKVEPRDEVLIKPQISGIISEVYKEAGQSVKQGEVIAKVKVIPGR